MNHLKWDLNLFERNRVSAAHYEMFPHDTFRCEKVFITAKVESLYLQPGASRASSFLIWN